MKHRYTLAATAVLAVAVSLTACSSSASTSSNSGDAYVPVVVGVGSDAAYAPFFVADQQGLFSAAGLDVTLTQFATGGDALSALSAGQIQMSQSSPATITSTIANNVNITAFVQDVDISETSHVVLRDGIDSAADVKNFGYVAGLSQYMAYQYFEANDIDPATINWVPASAADMPALMQRGDIDGFFLWDPWPTNVVDAGTGDIVATSSDFPTLTPIMVNWIATTHTWLEDNDATAQAIATVLEQAIDMINDDPQMAADAVEKAVAITSADALVTITADKFELAAITPETVTAAQTIGDFFVSTGAIDQVPDLANDLITDWSW